MQANEVAGLPEVARCKALIAEWSRLPEPRKTDVRRQIEEMVQAGIYVGSVQGGSKKRYRVDGVMLDGDVFYVQYAEHPHGKVERMPLPKWLPNIVPLGSPQAKFRILYRDAA